MTDYPPSGLSEGVLKLPEWIQKGCGDEEYDCEEKGATFLSKNMPDKLPDLSEHKYAFNLNRFFQLQQFLCRDHARSTRIV